MLKIKEYEVSIEQMKIEAKRVEGDERRKQIEMESDVAKKKAQYQDQFLVLLQQLSGQLMKIFDHQTS